MRFIVLLFGFVGCLLTAFLGGIFFLSGEALRMLHEYNIKELDFLLDSTDKNLLSTSIFLFLAAAFGLFGTLLAFFRCGWQGSLLLFVPLIGPAVVSPITLVGTVPQAFTALLSMFIGPLPINRPDDGADEEDED